MSSMSRQQLLLTRCCATTSLAPAAPSEPAYRRMLLSYFLDLYTRVGWRAKELSRGKAVYTNRLVGAHLTDDSRLTREKDEERGRNGEKPLLYQGNRLIASATTGPSRQFWLRIL